MDITPGAVRQLIFRARTALRDGLGLLLPVPLLRGIIEGGGAQAAAIGSGAAAGAGGAIAFKAGMVTLISGIAIGGGLALDHGDDRRDGPETAVASGPERESRSGTGEKPGTPRA